MPPPSRAFRDIREVMDEADAKKQIKDGKSIWHSDPADKGWDWDGPNERDQRLWEIK